MSQKKTDATHVLEDLQSGQASGECDASVAAETTAGVPGQPERDGDKAGDAPAVIHEAVADYQEATMRVSSTADRPLNHREGPGLHYPVMEQLPDGAQVLRLSLPYGAVVPGWCMIRSEAAVGWVDSRYLVPAEA